MPAKACRKDQIINPKTNRCVLRSGKIGRQVVANMDKKANVVKRRISPAKKKHGGISGGGSAAEKLNRQLLADGVTILTEEQWETIRRAMGDDCQTP